MPRSGSGSYSLPPVYLATPGTTVRSEQHNVPLRDIEQALTDSIPRNGSAPMTGNLPMGGRRVTGLGAPTADGDAATKQYVDTATVASSRIRMTGAGLLGSTTAPTSAPAVIGLGNGVEFSGSQLRARLGDGLSFVSGAITAAVARYAGFAGATGGVIDNEAMSPLRTRQAVNAWSLGIDQEWQDVTSSRTFDTSYRNTTGKPIMVAIVGDAITTNRRFQVSTNNSSWVVAGVFGESSNMLASIAVIVPDGHYYRVLGNVNINEWSELR